jgi:hypothetical protein
MKWLFGGSFAFVVMVAACGGTTSTPSGPGTNDAGSSGTDAGGGGTDAGGGMGTDSGGGGTDAGPVDAGLPPAATVTFDNCPAFTPCASDPTGTWDYTGACVDKNALTQFAAMCQGTEKPVLNNVTGTIQGRVVFTATQVARNAMITTIADVTIPLSCFTGSPIPINDCASAQTAINLQQPGTKCVNGADAQHCNCTLDFSTAQAGTNGYTVTGSQLKIDDGSVYDFCVMGTKLQHQQTTPASGSPPEPGVYELTKQ